MITATPIPLPDQVAWDSGRGVRVPRDEKPSSLTPPKRAGLFFTKKEAEEVIDCLCGVASGRSMVWPKTRDAFSVEADTTPDGMHWVCCEGATPNDLVLMSNLFRMWDGGRLYQVLNSSGAAR